MVELKHIVHAVAPAVTETVPAVQLVQAAELMSAEYVPAGHCTQVSRSAVRRVPGEQVTAATVVGAGVDVVGAGVIVGAGVVVVEVVGAGVVVVEVVGAGVVGAVEVVGAGVVGAVEVVGAGVVVAVAVVGAGVVVVGAKVDVSNSDTQLVLPVARLYVSVGQGVQWWISLIPAASVSVYMFDFQSGW